MTRVSAYHVFSKQNTFGNTEHAYSFVKCIYHNLVRSTHTSSLNQFIIFSQKYMIKVQIGLCKFCLFCHYILLTVVIYTYINLEVVGKFVSS